MLLEVGGRSATCGALGMGFGKRQENPTGSGQLSKLFYGIFLLLFRNIMKSGLCCAVVIREDKFLP